MGAEAIIYLIGDSMIEFGDWNSLLPGRTAVNLGCSGETAFDTLTRLDEIAGRDETPDIILFMTGTNNVAMEEFAFYQMYDEIIARARKHWPPSRLIINSLLPMNLAYLADDAISGINKELAAGAERLGVEFLDAFTPLSADNGKAEDGILADEVHITDKGYRRWAGIINAAIS